MKKFLELAVSKDTRDTESQLQPVMEKMLVKLEVFNKHGDFVTLKVY